jgi:hypothetical protein
MLLIVSMRPVSRLSCLSDTPDVFLHSPAMDRDLVRRGMHPPAVVCLRGLVWGRPLVAAAVEAGVAELPCVEVAADPAWRLLETALRLEGRADGYSPAETARMLGFLQDSGADRAEIQAVEPLVRSGGSFAAQAEQYRRLPPALQGLVEQGLVDLKTAAAVAALPQPAVAAFARGAPALSASSRRLLLRQVYEVVRRDSLGAPRAAELVREALEQPDPVEAARRVRHPDLSAMESTLREIVHSCVGSSGVQVDPPPYFEGDSFTVRFRFAGCRSLAEKLAAAGRLVDRCDELFDLLQ